MTTEAGPSRAPSIRSFRSGHSSLQPDGDIFSDDYALDSPVTIDESPLGDFPPPRQHYFDNPSNTNQTSTVTSYTDFAPSQSDRGSTAKRRLMIDDVPITLGGGLGRSTSTSSRITIPRTGSPYNGPTAPSHPYSMYPQMTRASSVASQSTLRLAPETPFVAPRRGPEHPYQLYPQNTVSEEDEDITTNGIPIGFPRNANFQPSAGGSNSDVGDIIGSDGHVETLPPYTRYADNTVAKGNMEDIQRRRLSRVSQATTQATDSITNAAPPSVHGSESLLVRSLEQFEEETEVQKARKEGWRGNWRDKARRPTVAGMPLWGLLTIVAVIIFSAIVGGVVGGVIGNRQGAQRAYANGAVTTIWLDAESTTLPSGASPLPTGHYQIPFNQTQEINQCIPSGDMASFGPAWGCMDIAYIGVNVYLDNTSNTLQLALEDFSVNTMDFRYGPQPPDFNGTSFTLQPMVDKDAKNLGAAWFFSVLFDKLSIIPEDVLQLSPNKREVDGHQFRQRSPAPYDGQPLRPAQQPWFCFWNSTINEFFIYLNQAAPNETSTQDKYIGHPITESYSSPSPTITSFIASSTTSSVLLQELTVTAASSQAATSFAAYNPTYPGRAVTSTLYERSYETSAANLSNYPKLIKMVEKRKPANVDTVHIQPYCQKMQVLDNWEIVPVPGVEKISISEVQYQITSSTASSNKLIRSWRRDVVSNLESYCVCEWTST